MSTAITLMRWMARGVGLIGVTLDSLLLLVATQAGTGSVWLTMVTLVGLAALGYVIACFGSFLKGAEGGLAEGIGGAMMIVGWSGNGDRRLRLEYPRRRGRIL